MIKVVNYHTYTPEPDHFKIYIGRVTSFNRVAEKWNNTNNFSALGNPFSGDEAIEKYKKHFIKEVAIQGQFRNKIAILYTMVKEDKEVCLICFCKPKPCHGDIIKEFIESY